MAVPSYATDLQDIYTDTDNFSTVGGGRVTAAETDDFIQGNNCWSHDPFSSGIEGGMYDDGTAPTITADDCVYIWTKCDVAATLATHAAGGIQVIMGSSTTAYDCFYVLGSDDYQYGGWKVIPVDPTKSPSTSVGTPGSYDHFGVRWNVPSTGASKGYPMKIDAIRYGRSASVTAGEVANPATWAGLAAYDATGTRQWGICQPNDAGVEIQGIVNWGTASTACHFDDDSGSTVIIIDTEWTATDFTQIVIDHASSVFNMDGLTIKALGTNNPGQFIFNNASTTSALKNSTFDSIGITTLRAGVTATNNKWKLTNTVTQNSATITSCTFDKSSASVALVVDDLSLVTGCTFNSDGSNHAVNLGTIAATATLSWDNTAVDYETYNAAGTSTGNEVILVSVSSGQTLTVNVQSGATTPSFYNTGTGDVSIVAGSVDLVVSAIKSDGTAVDDVSIAVYAKDGTGDLPYQDSITVSNSGTTATITHTAHGMKTGDKVLIQGGDEFYNRGVFTITVTTVNAYTYTMSGTPSGNPTGCTSTWCAMYVVTSGTNSSTVGRTFVNNQPVSGFVRKSTTSPLYQTAPISGTIDKSLGLNLTGLMLLDE